MARVESDYVSDHTKFINEEIKKHPQWRADQQQGRADRSLCSGQGQAEELPLRRAL